MKRIYYQILDSKDGVFIPPFVEYLAIISFIMYHILFVEYFYKSIIGYDFIYYFKLAIGTSLVFLTLNFKSLMKSFVNVEYLAFFRRIFSLVFTCFLLFEFVQTPYLIKVLDKSKLQKIESYVVPIKSLKLGRPGYKSIVSYKFENKVYYLELIGELVGEIKNNPSIYCVCININQSIDGLKVVSNKNIVSCNK